MALVAVDAAVRDEADEMKRAAPVAAPVHRVDERFVVEEIAVPDALVDPREVLVDDPAGAHVHVADLGVSHLAGRQADRFAGGDQLRMRVACEQRVVDRLGRQRDRVVIAFGAQSPPIEDHQYQRTSHYVSCFTADRPA